MKPILFEIGSFQLHSFGLLVALGFIPGTWIASRRAGTVGLIPRSIHDLVFPWLLVGGLIGARILYVISYWDRDFAGKPLLEAIAIWRGGLVFYGGLIGATLAGLIGIHLKKLPLWKTIDCLAPGAALGHVFGRLACLLNGCCYGRTCDLPWAIHLPSDHASAGLPIHPAQLYEAALNLILCGVLVFCHARQRFLEGQIFALYLMIYAMVRTVSEFFRGDYAVQSAPASGVFTPGQSTSAFIFVAGITLWFVRARLAASPAVALSNSPSR